MAKGSRSFSFAGRLLPSRMRDPVAALYAFCRVSDDLVDESDAPLEACRVLTARLDDVYRGKPANDPVDRALVWLAEEHALPRAPLDALLDGYAWDAASRRFETLSGTFAYASRVAASVGVAMTWLMGVHDHDVLARAADLGVAMQLTNIIRDVGDDARRGRIYLPISELQQFGVKAHELLARQSPWGYSDRFTALMQHQAQRAHQLFDEALALLPAQDHSSQRPGLMMANIYRSLLREIETGGFQVLHQRTSLTPLRKLWIAARTQWSGR